MGKKLLNYIGTIKTMNNKQHAKVVAYRNCKDMDIVFEDGTLVRNVRKDHFERGAISNPNFDLDRYERTGETRVMSNGLKATIVDYISYTDIAIKFETGLIVYHKRYDHFVSGTIGTSNLDYSNCKRDCIGVVVMQKCGLEARCIEYENAQNITVEFSDGTIVRGKSKNAFYKGSILHPKIDKSYYCNNKNIRIGERKQMNCGLFCTITSYIDSLNIDVTFDNGDTVRGRTYDAFKNGRIAPKNIINRFSSVPQMLCYYYIKQYFSDAVVNFRPCWLKNEITNVNFELDIYIPSIKVAIEYDGFNDLHIKHTDNESNKYNLIRDTTFIDKLIIIYEKDCIHHNKNSKYIEYQLSYQSKIPNSQEYTDLIYELLRVLEQILNYLLKTDVDLSLSDLLEQDKINYINLKYALEQKLIQKV